MYLFCFFGLLLPVSLLQLLPENLQPILFPFGFKFQNEVKEKKIFMCDHNMLNMIFYAVVSFQGPSTYNKGLKMSFSICFQTIF